MSFALFLLSEILSFAYYISKPSLKCFFLQNFSSGYHFYFGWPLPYPAHHETSSLFLRFPAAIVLIFVDQCRIPPRLNPKSATVAATRAAAHGGRAAAALWCRATSIFLLIAIAICINVPILYLCTPSALTLSHPNPQEEDEEETDTEDEYSLASSEDEEASLVQTVVGEAVRVATVARALINLLKLLDFFWGLVIGVFRVF